VAILCHPRKSFVRDKTIRRKARAHLTGILYTNGWTGLCHAGAWHQNSSKTDCTRHIPSVQQLRYSDPQCGGTSRANGLQTSSTAFPDSGCFPPCLSLPRCFPNCRAFLQTRSPIFPVYRKRRARKEPGLQGFDKLAEGVQPPTPTANSFIVD
jgi:hypothetical protein